MSVIGKTELLPIAWVKQIMLANHSEEASDDNFNPMSMDDFAEEIKENGLIHESVIEVSRKTKKTRLIAGNHRIQVLEEEGETHIPVYVMIVDEFDLSIETDDGSEIELTGIEDHCIGYNVESPSKVFSDIATLKYKNELPHIR